MPTDWTRAARNMQPRGAGQAGMGGGAIPYAPGATQYKPQLQMPGGSQPAAPQLPQGAGNGLGQQVSQMAQAPREGGIGQQVSQMAQAQGQQPQVPGQSPNPQMEQQIAYARALMERLRAEILRSRQRGNGFGPGGRYGAGGGFGAGGRFGG